MQQTPRLEPAFGTEGSANVVVWIEKEFDTDAVVRQLLCLVRLSCPDAHHVDAEAIEFALTLMQLREQLKAR